MEQLNYRIQGPLSLLQAAYREMITRPNLVSCDSEELTSTYSFGSLVLLNNGHYYGTVHKARQGSGFVDLSLPADWEKLIGILNLKSKLVTKDYVQEVVSKECYKVFKDDVKTLHVQDVYGKLMFLWADTTKTITGAEFIKGGLAQLANTGYVPGRWCDPLEGFPLEINYLTYLTLSTVPALERVIKQNGFVFAVELEGHRVYPVSECTLVAVPLTTESGRRYQVLWDMRVRIIPGSGEQSIYLKPAWIQSWLEQQVQSITLYDVTLTRKDLEAFQTPN
jgi:hypothetical protein